jgi:hypothetical protein
VVAALCVSAVGAIPARAAEYLPPKGKVWAGLTGGSSLQPYESLTDHHPPVFEDFITWDTHTKWLSHRSPDFRSRIAIHMSTAPGYGQPGVITTRGISLGHSDGFLVRMNTDLAHSRRIFYIRIMGEANGYWNPYCPYNSNGSARPGESTHDYIEAWRRTVLILRGGPVRTIDKKLHALGLPRVSAKLKRSAVLPRPKVTFIWAPETAGNPNVAGNEPGKFWPGSRYVDWVGTDVYSQAALARVPAFYDRFSGKPFDIPEWSVWGKSNPGFVTAIFQFVRSHSRVRMFNYFQGFGKTSEANPAKYKSSDDVLRSDLHSSRFPQYPPEYAHPPKHHHHHKPPPPPHPKHPGPPPTNPKLCIKLPLLGKVCL